MRLAVLAAPVALVALSSLPAAAATRARYSMGTVCEITAADDRQIAAAFREADRVERLLSTWTADSELARLNSARSGRVSEELRSVLTAAFRWATTTDGAFNPLVGPLLRAWDIRGSGTLPSRESIAAATAAARLSNVDITDEGTVRLGEGAGIEEGAFGKGYAIDRMLRLIEGAAMINFGGQIAVRGSRRVAIADPRRRQRPVVELTVREASLSTTSGSEKTFEAGGKQVTHIIDPRSGEALPPRGSASVIAADAMTADILSTALYVMGVEKGLRWAEAHEVAVLFITTDRRIAVSRRFREVAGELALLDREFHIQEK